MSKLLEQINNEKKSHQISELMDIKYGFGLPERDRVKGVIPVYASSGVVGFHNESKVKKPSIIIGRKGNVGSLSYSKKESYPIDTVFYIDETAEGFDLKYVYYLLQRVNLPRYGGDSAVPGLSRDTVYNIKVETPKEETQKKIASILGAYDEKIENNNKIIKNLEETAQTIFNEWFVNFKFPGYEKVKMVDSEMGEIPEGWKKIKLGDVFDIKYGKNLPTSKINEKGKFPVYGAGGVIGFYKEKNVDEKVVLVTCRGNGSGKIWRTNGEGFVTNNSFVILPKKDFNYINFTSTYFLFKNSNVESALSGSAQPQITIDGLNPIDLLLPSKYVLENFQRITKKVFDLIDKTEKENISLKSQRDLLLAKLI